MKIEVRLSSIAVLATVTLAALPGLCTDNRPAACRKVVLVGEVNAGQEWKAPIGEGWVFRVIPIQASPLPARYSGWDLVVDREPPAGYPDALLLASPPYDSINEREIGTTFGVRAQDAIGWNPRSFHFFTDPAAFQASQKLFAGAKQTGSEAGRKLMEAAHHAKGAGEFTILDARLTPGVADAASFAENWAMQSARVPHTAEPAPAGKATQMGTLNFIRFSITLWLPESWKTANGLHSTSARCQTR